MGRVLCVRGGRPGRQTLKPINPYHSNLPFSTRADRLWKPNHAWLLAASAAAEGGNHA